MLATITGATGLLGANLAIELLKQGHTVRATKRASSKTAHLTAFDIEWVDASLGDVASLTAAFEGADVVFHCAAMVSVRKKPTAALVAANVDGTRHVIEAALHAQVPRLVHCSTVGAVGLTTDGSPCTEESAWNFPDQGMQDGYVITKHISEELVHAAVADGLDAVVVNPTFMFGPYDVRPSSGALIVGVITRQTPGWTPGFNNFVDVRDVARGMVLAWEKGVAGERYILGGENLSYKDIFDRIAAAAGVPPLTWKIPRLIANLGGWFGDFMELISDKEPVINSQTVRWGFCRTFQFDSSKARRELGYTTSDLDAAIGDAIVWMRGCGTLTQGP